MKKQNKIILYQAKDGQLEFRGDMRKETLWATQQQIADVFGIERSVVTKHIRNILKDRELDKDSVCANFAHTADDGKTYQVQFYNLDIILAVGYRTNSGRAITFRQWATKTLKQHLLEGYTINKKRIAQNYDKFLDAVERVRALLPTETIVSHSDVLELVKMFGDTWMSLHAYDKQLFDRKGTKKKVRVTAEDLSMALTQLKKKLVQKGEATEIFGQGRTKDSVEGIVGNVFQSFGGKDLYPTVEAKAAHLLYFMVKNHPFTDGNKRSGAFAFVWFLSRARLLKSSLTPEALTALTLLIAESKPSDKERMVGLVAVLLGR